MSTIEDLREALADILGLLQSGEMRTSITAISLLQQGPDQSPDSMISDTPATVWLYKRRSTSPILLTIPATRPHSLDPTTEDHACYEKLWKTRYCFNLYDHGDDLI
jgi:hypothetical protein